MSCLFYNLEAGTTTAEALEKWLEKGLFIPLSGPYYAITAQSITLAESEDRRRL